MTAERETLIREMQQVNPDGKLDDYLRDFAFDGFDPVTFYRHLKTLEKSVAKLKMDMGVLCIFLLLRGPNINKHLKRSTQAARDHLDPLVKKYKIVDNVPLNKKSITTVSGGRILACFPALCSSLVANGAIRDPVGAASTCPTEYRFFAAPSIIPTFDLFEEWFDWAVKMDKIVNPGTTSTNLVMKFGLIVYRSTHFRSIPMIPKEVDLDSVGVIDTTVIKFPRKAATIAVVP